MEKINKALVACVALAVFTAGLFIGKGSSNNALLKQKAEYRAVLKAKDVLFEESDKKIAELYKEIAERNTDISDSQEKIVSLGETIVLKDERIAELVASEPQAPELEQHPLVINLRSQIQEWADKFSLCSKQGAEKDAIAFSLKENYDSLVIIKNETEGKLNLELLAHDKAKELIQLQDKKIIKLQREKYLMAAGGGVIALTVLILLVRK